MQKNVCLYDVTLTSSTATIVASQKVNNAFTADTLCHAVLSTCAVMFFANSYHLYV